MLKYTVVFLIGVFVGQEYGTLIPNVKTKAIETFNEFKKTDLYKKINDDLKKK
jgi:hypothetical protein